MSFFEEEGLIGKLKRKFKLPKLTITKRFKTGVGEDDWCDAEDVWCDALNELSVDSSSSEEYFDALQDDRTSKKRKKSCQKTTTKQKSSQNSEMLPYCQQPPAPPAPPSSTGQTKRIESGSSSRGVAFGGSSGSSVAKSLGYQFDPGASSSSGFPTSKKTGPYLFNAEPSSSSSSVGKQPRAHGGPRGLTSNKERLQQQQQNLEQSSTDTDGVSDKILENLAKALLGGEVKNARSLGRKLGFTGTEVYKYCGYQNPSESGIRRMLYAWRDGTPRSKQRTDLIEALTRADLNHLANELYPHAGTITGGVFSSRSRKITVTLMTSSQLFTIKGLKKKLNEFKQSRSDLIKEVRVLQLPYSRIQFYTFTEPVDVMILCHSIDNRRFAITNVTDSLYDAFLDYCNKELGKERISVIAHDFPPEDEKVRKTKMDTFKHTQYSTFENAGLVMICGMLDKEPEIKEQDWDCLVKFLEAASRSDPDKADTSPTPPAEKHTPPSPSKPRKPETANGKKGKSFGLSSLPGTGKVQLVRSRKPIIYVCTSWGLNSVRGLKEQLQALISRPFFGCEIREQELPYSRLNDFRFPSEADKRDAMILCHSVQNRGFSVTDVPNSIYDDYLTYCNRFFGKDHVAVIVHDFEYPIEILKVHIDTFRRGQPTTFELAKFIALAGKLDVPNVQLVHDDSQNLEKFVKGLR